MSEAKPPRKILIAYQTRPPIIDYLKTALARRGIATEHFHADENTLTDRYLFRRINKLAHNFRLLPKNRAFFEQHPLTHKNYRSQRLQRQLDSTDADLVLIIRGWSYRTEVLQCASPLIGWWVEAETRLGEALPEIGLFDWYYMINRNCVELAQKQGHRHVSYLPHAINTERFRPLPDEKKRYDVCFVGGWSQKRQAYLEAALRVTTRVAIVGPGWIQHNLARPRLLSCIKGRYVAGEALVRLYNQTRVVLNITNWEGRNAASRSGMTMRILEVPACGAFLLTDRTRELEELFQPGTHLGIFENLADFPRQLAHWLQHAPERQAAAQAARQQCQTLCSYDHLIDILLAKYRELAADRPRAANPTTAV